MYEVNFTNDGRGQVFGLEMMLRHSPSRRFMGWLSYTLMKSTVHNVGERKHLSPHDQRHVLTAWGNVNLGHNWDVDAKFQLATGTPDTPIVGHESGIVEKSDGSEVPVYQALYGEPYSTRMPLFHQLDIRITKRFQFKQIELSGYLELLNIYNQRTPQYYYSLPLSTKRYAYAPNHFYPNLGITATF